MYQKYSPFRFCSLLAWSNIKASEMSAVILCKSFSHVQISYTLLKNFITMNHKTLLCILFLKM